MGDYTRGQLDLDDEDRLPWLEPVVDEDASEGVSPLKLLLLILGGLALLALIVGGAWWIQDRKAVGPQDEGTLIAAPKNEYKIAAKEADAKMFDGEGDASFAASEGVARDGRIDASRVPEAPITGTTPPVEKPKPPVASKPASSFSGKVADETNARPAQAAAAPKPGGAMIQLGAYGSASGAKDAWGRLSKRFAYLAPLAMTVEAADVGGGTVYRLRAAAGAQAGTLCGKLKVAGESCLVVN